MRIVSRKELNEILKQDALANNRDSIFRKPVITGTEEIWSLIRLMRKCEYFDSANGLSKLWMKPLFVWSYLRYKKKQVKLGITIPIHFAQPGFSIAHIGCIAINQNAKIGKNCRLHEGVCIGANGTDEAATIGNNVFIGSGAKIIGKVTIADDVAIGAGAVVVKDILEAGTSWGGVPAKKVSNNNSHKNLSKKLHLE